MMSNINECSKVFEPTVNLMHMNRPSTDHQGMFDGSEGTVTEGDEVDSAGGISGSPERTKAPVKFWVS